MLRAQDRSPARLCRAEALQELESASVEILRDA